MNNKGEVSISTLGLTGSILASVLSWIVNKSILWLVIHFFCSWIYVIYWMLVKTRIYDWLVSLTK